MSDIFLNNGISILISLCSFITNNNFFITLHCVHVVSQHNGRFSSKDKCAFEDNILMKALEINWRKWIKFHAEPTYQTTYLFPRIKWKSQWWVDELWRAAELPDNIIINLVT